MKKYLAVAILSVISATSVQAIENQKTVCSHGGQTRVIEVVYTSEDNVPCEVNYSKEEGSTKLWSATNLEGYCEKKAAAFVEKQVGWGWSCEAAVNPAAEAPLATEAVAPEPQAKTTEVTDSAEPIASAE